MTSTGPPVLETARLLLDAHQAADLDALAALWADAYVVRHIGGVARSRQDCWFRLLRYRGLWPVMGYGYWAVREKATGRFVGDAGFGEFEREVTPPLAGQPEAGWAFASKVHGRGYATEALTAILGWLDRHTVHRRVVCMIDGENRASLRVAEKTGFVRCGTTTGPSGTAVTMQRER